MRRTLLSLFVLASVLLAGCDRTDRDFGDSGVSRFGIEPTSASAQLGQSGFVVAGQRPASNQTIVASFASDGAERWQVAIPSRFRAVTPVVALSGDRADVVGTTGGRIEVARVRDGSLVSTFGTDGIASTNVPISQGIEPVALVDSQRRTVVLGQRATTMVYARIGTTGEVERNVDLRFEDATPILADAVMTADDHVVVALSRVDGDASDIALVRLTSRGFVDESFGDDGIVVLQLPADSSAATLVQRSDGRLVVAGTTVDASRGVPQVVLAGYTADGVPDPAFGGFGLSFVDEPAIDAPVLVAGGPGFVVAMSAGGGDIVTRGFSASGAVDDAWGDGGRQVHDLGGAASVADAVQRGERTIVVAQTDDAPGGALLAVR